MAENFHTLKLRATHWYKSLDPEAEKITYPTPEDLRGHLEAGGIDVLLFNSLGMGEYGLTSTDDTDTVQAVWALYSGEVVFENPDVATLRNFLTLTSEEVPLSHQNLVEAIQAIIRTILPGEGGT